MQYASWKEQGLPIGSGLVEAACKTLVTQRLKLSGIAYHREVPRRPSATPAGHAPRFRNYIQSNAFTDEEVV